MISAKELKRHKRQMRRSPTPSERAFDERLWNLGVLFQRQIIIGFYCVDFLLPDRLLVIELDGPEHERHIWYDARRDAFIRGAGFSLIRIPNGEVHSYPIVQRIKEYPERPLEVFRSCLGRALAMKGNLMQRQWLKDSGQKSLFSE